MATPIVWKNVQVAMQSAIGSALTITGITKANPGVVTSTSHGLTEGQYAFLLIEGMHQLNEKVVRVTSPDTNTFALEGVDTTDFDDFTSGTAQLITFGTNVVTARTLTASGGEFDFIDTTTIHDNTRKQIPGLPSAISYQFEHIWDATDSGLLAMKAASDIQSRRAFKFTFGSGGKILVFAGFVGCSMIPGGQAQNLVTTSAVITMNGTPTYYAS